MPTVLAADWQRPSHPRPDYPYDVTVHHRGAARVPARLLDSLPESLDDRGVESPPALEAHRDHGSCVLLGSQREGAWLRVTRERAVAHVWGSLDAGAHATVWCSIAIHEGLRASGLLPLHCSAAVAPGASTATAFLAPSGTGKSTTLVRLAREGWDPVCEDFAWLDPATGVIIGWDAGVRLRVASVASEDTVAQAVRADVLRLGRASVPKHLVPFSTLERRFGVTHRPEVQLGRIVALRRASGPQRWTSLERVEAVPVLWEAVGLPLSRFAREDVARTIARLIDELERETLWLGDLKVDSRTADAG